MKFSSFALIGVFSLVLLFQNCSQQQFGPKKGYDLLQSMSLDSIDSGLPDTTLDGDILDNETIPVAIVEDDSDDDAIDDSKKDDDKKDNDKKDDDDKIVKNDDDDSDDDKHDHDDDDKDKNDHNDDDDDDKVVKDDDKDKDDHDDDDDKNDDGKKDDDKVAKSDEDRDCKNRSRNRKGKSDDSSKSKSVKDANYVCILSGSGKSARLGLVSGDLKSLDSAQKNVCMTKAACESVVSQKFSVKEAAFRGYCKEASEHSVPLSEEQLRDLLNI